MGRQAFGTRMVCQEFLRIQLRPLQHLIRRVCFHGVQECQNRFTHQRRRRMRIISRSEMPVWTVTQKFSHPWWGRFFEELWSRPTTTADFRSSFRQIPCTSNVCLLEDKIQDWGMHLFTISYGCYALDQRSGDGWSSGWIKVFVINKRNSNAKFWSSRCEDCFGTEQNHPKCSLQKKDQSGDQKEDRFLRGRQIAYLIYEYFRVTGTHDSVEKYADLLTIGLRNDDIQEFDSKWDGIFLSMTKIPPDDILEGLYKLRVRESEKLKTVLELYDLEIHQKKTGPDHHRFKTMVKRSIEQDSRNKNIGARNGNYERNAVVKNQGTEQRGQRIPGDCWQWEANGQCSKGDNCCFRHDVNKRAKTTQPNPSPNSFMQQSERNASRTRSPRGRSTSGRMSRWPCKDYLQGTCTNSFCEKWPSRMLVLQDQEWLQIRWKVLVCTSPGWRTA